MTVKKISKTVWAQPVDSGRRFLKEMKNLIRQGRKKKIMANTESAFDE